MNSQERYDLLLILVGIVMFLASLFMLGGCEKVQQGPETDLTQVAIPTPLPEPPPVKPVPGPPVNGDVFRAYEPGQVSKHGDSRSGRWLTLSTTPPEAEVIQPKKPLPRMPRHAPGKAAQPAPEEKRVRPPTTPVPTPPPQTPPRWSGSVLGMPPGGLP